MKLEDRLHIAIKTLEGMLAQNDEMYRRSDTERLRGKIDGIKLALSYMNEEKMERVRELSDNHERMMKIAYDYSETDDEMCGDYPAPCNCDDPRTHNGH
jgi:hypothetical protein